MDSQGVIRCVIENSESEDSRNTAELAHAIHLSLEAHDRAPYRPTSRFVYDTTESPPAVPPPPPSPKPSPPSSPPPRMYWNPRILIHNDSQGRPAPWGNPVENESSAVIEDVTILLTDTRNMTPEMLHSFMSDVGFPQPSIHVYAEGEPYATGESEEDDVGSIHGSNDPHYGSSTDRP